MYFADTTGLFITVLLVPAILAAYLLYIRRSTDRRKKPGTILILLRCLIVLCLCIALAEPYFSSQREQGTALLLLDISDSMDQAQAQELIDRASQYVSSDFSVNVVPFAKEGGWTRN